MSHSASLATSRVVQHRTTLRSMWSPWVDNLSERPCCDGGLTSSAPIRLSWLVGHVAPGKGNKTNNTQLDSWPSALHRCDLACLFFWSLASRRLRCHGDACALLELLSCAMTKNNGTRDRLSQLSTVRPSCHRP